ncbi:hypothetical protein ACIBU0_01810 [Streptomyces sp. NPDC049627]|uniref:hypothetical protein n=1 Tax=Streptomyces sp. NPDC049627 TaxID=3365595 RepID=UPI0037A4B6F9
MVLASTSLQRTELSVCPDLYDFMRVYGASSGAMSRATPLRPSLFREQLDGHLRAFMCTASRIRACAARRSWGGGEVGMLNP